MALTPLKSPIKGKTDWRDFRCFRLENGVTVCLVHDKESKSTAGAATVNVGASADPRELSGLAHFCEHMCFLGSEKYPGENDYQAYLSQHGGRSNASTSMHLTTYKFDILADYAEHAIDLFSQFFVAPLFTKSGTGREVNAVDSENSKNLVSDGRRRLQILKAFGDPTHYYTKFSTGNSKTLPTDTEENLVRIRDALLAFHKKHYRPENMTVVIAGPQSLDTLQEWAVTGFAAMKATPFPEKPAQTPSERLVDIAALDAPPYGCDAKPSAFRSPFMPRKECAWPCLVTSEPVRSMRKLDLMFPLPPTFVNPDRSPAAILSHLLGHEGPHSSFAVLQNAGLLSSLTAGSRSGGPDFTLFHVEIGLTEEGEERWKDVAGVIFQHCRLIARTAQAAVDGSPEEMQRLWGENSRLNAMFFEQASPNSVYSVAPSLCGQILAYGTEKCISQGSMLNETAETAPLVEIADFASRLVPTNCFIERSSKAAWKEMVDSNQGKRHSEQWYGVDYIVSEIENSDREKWEGGSTGMEPVALPRPNRYIPRSMDLCPDLPDEAKSGARIEKEICPPNLVAKKDCGRLWHRLDDRYALPKSWFTLLFRNAAVENIKKDGLWQYDTTAAIHSSLLASMFDAALAIETYDASLAGLHFNLSFSSDGIRLTCSGFSDRLSDFAKLILRQFIAGDFIQELYFASERERTIRSLKTYFESRRGDSQAVYYRDYLLGSRGKGLDHSIEVAEMATLESIKEHHQRLLRNEEFQLDCLYTGNISETEAKEVFEAIYTDSISVLEQARVPSWIPATQERRLESSTSTELHFASKNTHEENGAVVVSFQSPIPAFRGDDLSSNESLVSSASIRLICHMIREPIFDELRTKQALGYIVSAYYDMGISSAPPNNGTTPWTVPVDYIVINVLSRKASPEVLLKRIDDFLVTFRTTLSKMPDSEINDYSSALSMKLLKPIRDLKSEAWTHFSKIRRHAPEAIENQIDVPWDNSKTMASALRSLRREDLLKTWDGMMLKNTRARVVSSVYGTTFPLNNTKRPSQRIVVNDLSQLTTYRKTLEYFDSSQTKRPRFLGLHPAATRTLAVVAVCGAVATGVVIAGRRSRAARK